MEMVLVLLNQLKAPAFLHLSMYKSPPLLRMCFLERTIRAFGTCLSWYANSVFLIYPQWQHITSAGCISGSSSSLKYQTQSEQFPAFFSLGKKLHTNFLTCALNKEMESFQIIFLLIQLSLYQGAGQEVAEVVL